MARGRGFAIRQTIRVRPDEAWAVNRPARLVARRPLPDGRWELTFQDDGPTRPH